jgi:hypothetical protein
LGAALVGSRHIAKTAFRPLELLASKLFADDCVRAWQAFVQKQKIKTVLPDKIHRLFSEIDSHFLGKE